MRYLAQESSCYWVPYWTIRSPVIKDELSRGVPANYSKQVQFGFGKIVVQHGAQMGCLLSACFVLSDVNCWIVSLWFFFIGSLLFAFAIHLDSFPRFNKGKLSFKAGYFALEQGRFFNMINVESIEQSSQAKLQLILIFSLWNTIFNPLVWSCSHVWLWKHSILLCSIFIVYNRRSMCRFTSRDVKCARLTEKL